MPTTVRAVSDISVPAPLTNHQTRPGASRTNANNGPQDISKGSRSTADISLSQAALAGGLGLLLLAVLAAIANFGILKTLIVPGDAQTTAQHIAAAPGLFRLGIGAFFAVAILDVVVAWALYIVLRPVNRSLSLLAALFRVVYATMLAVALNNLVSALQLLGGAEFLKGFGTDQLQAQMMVLLSAFESGWDLSLIAFGVHLLVVGMLVFRSGKRHQVLGILVIAAGLGYLIDGCGKLLVPDYSLSIAMYTFVGEPLLIFWLLWKAIRGVDTKRANAS
jgi:uncharacterized membrane protein